MNNNIFIEKIIQVVQENNSYKLIISFNYEVNLEFACNALTQNNIRFETIIEDNKFSLLVHENNFKEAKNILHSLDLDDSIILEENEGYTSGFIEWTEKQYVPGTYTGSKLPFWIKDKINLKLYGLLSLFFGGFFIFITIYELMDSNKTHINSKSLVFSFVYFFIGIIMTYRAFRKYK